MSYRDQMKEWVSYANREFGHYLPKDFPMHLFGDPGVSDDALSYMAKTIYNIVKTSQDNRYGHNLEAKSNSENELFYLVPQVDPDGSVYYMDRFRGGVVMSMVRQPNGLFSYLGPRRMMTMFGGRNELGGMINMIGDGDFHHDRK